MKDNNKQQGQDSGCDTAACYAREYSLETLNGEKLVLADTNQVFKSDNKIHAISVGKHWEATTLVTELIGSDPLIKLRTPLANLA